MMKQKIKKVVLRTGAVLGLCFILLLGIVLNPSLLYSKSSEYGNTTVYHNQELPKEFTSVLRESKKLTRSSEIYDAHFHIDLCLNDGSSYPKMIQLIKGPAFAHGFYNKVVITSEANFAANHAIINGRKWNLTQLIAHEMLHCYQYNTYGFGTFKFPMWKLEGYPEYISRKGTATDLIANIDLLLDTDSDEGWIDFQDGTGSGLNYYQDRLLVQFLMEIKGWNYQQIVDDNTSRDQVEASMMKWYKSVKEEI
jgi:hypothetical protein